MGGLMWRPSHVLKMLQALSYKQTHSERLVKNGAVPVIIRVMLNEKGGQGRNGGIVSVDGEGNLSSVGQLGETRGGGGGGGGESGNDQGMADSTVNSPVDALAVPSMPTAPSPSSSALAPPPPSPSPPGHPLSLDHLSAPRLRSSTSGAPDPPVAKNSWRLVDVDLALYSCRTLTNLASWGSLRKSLISQGVVQVMTVFKDHHDLRVADAARTCLLLLDETKENQEAKIALLTQSDVEVDENEDEEQE